MTTTTPVNASERHSKSKPCPICGGHSQMQSGKGERCYGYVGANGSSFCTRTDNPNAKSKSENAAIHFLDGRCQCGQPHADGSNQKPDAWRTKSVDWRGEAPERPKESERVLVEDPPKPWVHPDEATEMIYDYTNDQGADYIVEVVRFTDEYREKLKGKGKTVPKTLPRFRTDEGVFLGLPSAIGKTDGVHLYRQRDALEGIRMGYPLHIVEGEKDANRARSEGLIATTNINGALAFKSRQAEMIAHAWRESGKDSELFLILDRDVAGINRGEKIAGMLIEAGFPADRIKAVQSATAGDGDDLSDHLDAGFGPNDLDPVELDVLARSEMEEDAPYPIIDFADIQPDLSNNYLIKGLIDEKRMSVLYGASGVGKSFLAMELSLAVGAHQRWRDRRTKHGRVIYVAAEGAHGMRNRLYGARQHFALGEARSVGFSLVPSTVRLTEDEPDINRFVQNVTDHVQGGVDLVVIDTLSRSMVGDENSSKDMMHAVRAATIIMQRLDCAVLIIHHSGKREAMGMRGSSALRAAIDTELELTKSADGVGTLRAAKQKDRDDGDTWMHRLEPIEIGVDDDGDPVTTAIVRPITGREAAEVAAASQSTKRKTSKLSVDVVEACATLHNTGKARPVPANVLAKSGYAVFRSDQGWDSSVTVKGFERHTLSDLLRERFFCDDPRDGERDDNRDESAQDAKREAARARQGVKRRIDTAIHEKVLESHGGWVWLREGERDGRDG